LDGEVYLSHAGASEGHGGFEKHTLFADEGQDASVVVGVGVEAKYVYAGDDPDGVCYA
jgi:hypothetical protein